MTLFSEWEEMEGLDGVFLPKDGTTWIDFCQFINRLKQSNAYYDKAKLIRMKNMIFATDINTAKKNVLSLHRYSNAARAPEPAADMRHMPEVDRALAHIEQGDLAAAVIRMLVMLAGSRGSVRKDAMTDPIVPGMISIEGIPLMKPPYGSITAIDLSKGEKLWRVTHGETPDAIKNHPLLKGVTIPKTGQSGILGTLTTKSLVICGDCGLFTDETGRKGARLRAYDKATGKEVGAVFMDKVQTGATMTYMQGGKQYLVCAIGSSYGADLVAFTLPGAAPAAPLVREER